MYKDILTGRNVLMSVAIIFLAAFFVAIYANYTIAADIKSEEELLEKTRLEIEKYLDNEENDKRIASSRLGSGGTRNDVIEEAPVVKEEEQSAGEEKPVVEETAIIEEKMEAEEKPVVEERPIVEEKPVVTEYPVIASPEGAKQSKGEVASAASQSGNDVTEEKKEESAPAKEIQEVPSITASSEPQSKTASNQPIAEPVLKRMTVERIGSEASYETFQGLRPFGYYNLPKYADMLKYFTVAQRVEIYQEPRPVDSYILDAFAMRYIYANQPWNLDSDYRTQITPLFTRAYGTEITMSNPNKASEALIRYTHDYREIYRNYYPKYPQIKYEMWDQNEIMLMHSKEIEPIGWLYTSNLGYRYSTMDAKNSNPPVPNDKSYYEIRHTYFGSLALVPNDKLELFGQAEYFKSMHVKSYYDYRPDHFLGRTEIRIKSDDFKTSFIPSISYSKDYYWPFKDTYQKYEIQYRVGRDFTKRFSATSTVKYVMGFRDEPDNKGPLYAAGYINPHKDKAYSISLENRFSYNVYDRLYLQAGLDLANGLNWSIFDNWGMLAGLEYYAPGIIRVDFGWRGNYYYNLEDFLSTLYFKVYFFM